MSIPMADEAVEGGLPSGWTKLAPGQELGRYLALVEWSALSDRELVDGMDAARRQVTWTQARLLEGIGELSRRRTEEDPRVGSETHRRICGEVSLELMIPTGQAEDLIAMADTLPSLPHAWAAMGTGQIDYERARVMVDGLIGLDDDLARRLDAELAAEAVGMTLPQ